MCARRDLVVLNRLREELDADAAVTEVLGRVHSLGIRWNASPAKEWSDSEITLALPQLMAALGAGSDASTTWLRALLLVTRTHIVFLLLVRFLPGGKREAERARPSRRRPAQVPASALAVGRR